jgi:hypothetical protein
MNLFCAKCKANNILRTFIKCPIVTTFSWDLSKISYNNFFSPHVDRIQKMNILHFRSRLCFWLCAYRGDTLKYKIHQIHFQFTNQTSAFVLNFILLRLYFLGCLNVTENTINGITISVEIFYISISFWKIYPLCYQLLGYSF